jgi:hypothetical protein
MKEPKGIEENFSLWTSHIEFKTKSGVLLSIPAHKHIFTKRHQYILDELFDKLAAYSDEFCD